MFIVALAVAITVAAGCGGSSNPSSSSSSSATSGGTLTAQQIAEKSTSRDAGHQECGLRTRRDGRHQG